jgi:hypothetical protein
LPEEAGGVVGDIGLDQAVLAAGVQRLSVGACPIERISKPLPFQGVRRLPKSTGPENVLVLGLTDRAIDTGMALRYGEWFRA